MEFSAKMLIQRWQRAEEANRGGEALTGVSNRAERTLVGLPEPGGWGQQLPRPELEPET